MPAYLIRHEPSKLFTPNLISYFGSTCQTNLDLMRGDGCDIGLRLRRQATKYALLKNAHANDSDAWQQTSVLQLHAAQYKDACMNDVSGRLYAHDLDLVHDHPIFDVLSVLQLAIHLVVDQCNIQGLKGLVVHHLNSIAYNGYYLA